MRRDSQGAIRSLRCSGHAAFDIEGGVDIVCAGVSALTGALALGLGEVVGIDALRSEADGLLDFSIPENISGEQWASAQVLLKTVVLALSELERNYKGFLAVETL